MDTSIIIGHFIAIAACFISIITLIVQFRANRKQLEIQNNQLKLQNYIEYTKRYQDIIINFPEDINEPSFDMQALDQGTYDKTMRYMRVYFDLCFEEYYLHQEKLIDDNIWSTWEGGMIFAFSKSAFKQAWQKIKTDTEYNDSFNAMVENSHD